jgi:hypothetical protein
MRRALILTVVVAACAPELGSEVLVPDQVPVVWDAAYNGVDDGLGALVPVDVMVYDGETGQPIPGLAVEVWTMASAAVPIALESAFFVAASATPKGFVSEEGSPWDGDPTAYSGNDGEGSEGALEDGEPAPAVVVADGRVAYQFWDALHDDFVAVVMSDDLELTTDEGGVTRLYLFVDAFPWAQGAAGPRLSPIEVAVASGDQEAVFYLVPR